jgi:hypothetical protein
MEGLARDRASQFMQRVTHATVFHSSFLIYYTSAASLQASPQTPYKKQVTFL